jgi:adenine phosphoribosyltransferase
MRGTSEVNLKPHIRRIPDFKGVVFWDVTTLLNRGNLLAYCVNSISEHFRSKNVDAVVSPEARGFILAGAVAYSLNVGFVPIRKSGKLPSKTISLTYVKEYEKDVIEMHEDSIANGDRVLFIDDLLATGGSALAGIKLVESLGGRIVGLGFLIELEYLSCKFKKEIENKYDMYSLVKYRSVNDV